jgi:hypothetical protein
MDLNIKLQGLKYNLEKVWGGVVKRPSPTIFWKFLIYFSIGKSME